MFGGAPMYAQENMAWKVGDGSAMVKRSSYRAGSSNQINTHTKKTIKNASLNIEVKNVKQIIKQVTDYLQQVKGYIASSNYQQAQYNQGPTANMTLRVPAESLNTTLEKIKGLATKVNYESIQSKDISDSYYDVKNQLENLNLAKQQLEKILNQADTIKDKVAVYKILADKEKQIKVLSAKMQYYDESVAYSKINLTIRTMPIVQSKQQRTWNIVPTAKLAFEQLINSISNILEIIIYGTVYLIPILLLWIFILTLIFMIVRKVKHRKE